jgi:hypothetical protein
MSARHSGWAGKGCQIDRTSNGLEASSKYVQVKHNTISIPNFESLLLT